MADQPVQTPAQPVEPQAPTPVPAPTTADGQPVTPATNIFDTLADEDKTYLKSQGISEMNDESWKKLVNHNISLRKTSASQGGQPQTPTAPETPVTPASQPQPTPNSDGELDQLSAFTLANQLATTFPTLKDDLTSGQFYKDMSNLGIPLKVGGQVNLNGLLNYGKMVNDQRTLAAKLEEAGKPGEGAIPDANPTTPQQPAADAPMTKQIALAIGAHVAKGNTHPRQSEALQFLQKS